MKKNVAFGLSLCAIVLASAWCVAAQEKQSTFEREGPTTIAVQGPEGPITNTWTFVNSEFSFDKLVKGAPYSARAVTETTQTLSDGNRIVRSSNSSVYRDGEGRTRREQTLKEIGPFPSGGESYTTVSINDPVAGVAYVLEPNSHTARKIQGYRVEAGAGGYKIAGPGEEGANFTFKRTEGGEVRLRRGTEEAKVREEKERTAFRREDLGTQTIEGVSATGTKTTLTIPAGQIGNERAIEIVDERWFSFDLQTMVMTRHSDPRSGETVYRLTNINRTEPVHSLFEVPADYKLTEQPEMFRANMEMVPQQ